MLLAFVTPVRAQTTDTSLLRVANDAARRGVTVRVTTTDTTATGRAVEASADMFRIVNARFNTADIRKIELKTTAERMGTHIGGVVVGGVFALLSVGLAGLARGLSDQPEDELPSEVIVYPVAAATGFVIGFTLGGMFGSIFDHPKVTWTPLWPVPADTARPQGIRQPGRLDATTSTHPSSQEH
jgi:hypothetical protein